MTYLRFAGFKPPGGSANEGTTRTTSDQLFHK
jgi:hypothetical protein